MIEGKKIFLRAMEPADIGWLYKYENDCKLWQYGNRTQPISRADLAAFVEHSSLDLYEQRQLRLMISTLSEQPETIGAIDVFDFDPFHLHASLGVLVASPWQSQGFATDALETFAEYLHSTFGIRALIACVSADNAPSRKLFERCGFRQAGVLPQWLRQGKDFIDEIQYVRLL